MMKDVTLNELGSRIDNMGSRMNEFGSKMHEFGSRMDNLDSRMDRLGSMVEELGSMMGHVIKHMATKDDVAELRTELKGDIMNVQVQVNSIETQLRGMNHGRLEVRVADLEEEVFGEICA